MRRERKRTFPPKCVLVACKLRTNQLKVPPWASGPLHSAFLGERQVGERRGRQFA